MTTADHRRPPPRRLKLVDEKRVRCRGAVAQLAQSRDDVLGRRMLMKSQAIEMAGSSPHSSSGRNRPWVWHFFRTVNSAGSLPAAAYAFFLAVSARSAQRAAETIALSTGGKT